MRRCGVLLALALLASLSHASAFWSWAADEQPELHDERQSFVVACKEADQQPDYPGLGRGCALPSSMRGGGVFEPRRRVAEDTTLDSSTVRYGNATRALRGGAASGLFNGVGGGATPDVLPRRALTVEDLQRLSAQPPAPKKSGDGGKAGKASRAPQRQPKRVLSHRRGMKVTIV
jgi:hypothetical protein